MSEYITKAFILGYEIKKEDTRTFNIFTESFGRLKVRAPGGAKILSRLSPHLPVGALSRVKIVEKNNLTVVDAIVLKKFFNRRRKNKNEIFFMSRAFGVFNLLMKIFPEGLPDNNLWQYISFSLENGYFDIAKLLSILGYNPKSAACVFCSSRFDIIFDIKDQNFICKNCILASKNFHDELIYINDNDLSWYV